MAASDGDLIQLVDNQRYAGQQCLNVYYYRVTAPLGLSDGYLADINDWWDDNVLSKIKVVQNVAVEHLSREWRNLSNGTDLFVDSTLVGGEHSATASTILPSFISFGFLLQRESLVTRNGYKRFVGVTDDQVSGNDYVGDTGDMDDIATALASDVTIGLATLAEPVIVKRPIVVPVSSYVYSSIGSATFRGIGTQNTRKAGRGV